MVLQPSHSSLLHEVQQVQLYVVELVIVLHHGRFARQAFSLPRVCSICTKSQPPYQLTLPAALVTQALKAFRQLAALRPGDPEIAKMLARLYHQLGNSEEARDVLQAHLHDYPTAVDLTHINILAELYMEASEWSLAVDNIQYAHSQLCGQAGLPVELQVSALHPDLPAKAGCNQTKRCAAALIAENPQSDRCAAVFSAEKAQLLTRMLS